MNINWSAVLTGTATFIIVLVLKLLLDLKLVQWFVKYFSWLPVRNYFRTKPPSICGHWEQTWESGGSKNFTKSTDRHSHPVIRQLGSYCYAEFISKSVTYVVFGRIIGCFVIGDWYDKNDPLGYYGAFQLQIINATTMKGRWIGHSKSIQDVKGDEWSWTKLSVR